MKLQGFQKKFLGQLLRPGIRTAALSLPRGNGKSTLCAWLCARLLDPKDPLFVNGQEIYLVASSLSQCCRTTFGILRKLLPKAGYRIAESTQVASILHLDSRTRLSVLPASGKSNAGIVGAAYVICDEPASWHEQSGTLLHESIAGALGKPGSDLRIIYAGTKAIGGISPPDPNNWSLMALASRGGSTRRWRKLRAHVIRRDGGRCQRCGSSTRLEVHHIIPAVAGGQDTPANLRAMCEACHDRLHGR